MSEADGTPEISVAGFAATHLEIHVPNVGPWFCDADLVDNPPASGKVTVRIGESFRCTGTIDPRHDGSFALSRRTRIVAGAGAWGAQLPAQPGYRNDAGVRASEVAQDAARAAGETLGSFAGAQPVLGAHYARNAGPASRTLEDAARGAPWWVDFEGVTHVGDRPAGRVVGEAVRLLEYDTRLNQATLAVDDLTQLGIGSVITDERLEGPIMVTSYQIVVTPEHVRVLAWCGDGVQTQLADVIRALVQRVTDVGLFGKYRYRVVTLEADRVNVQSVRPSLGLPDILSVSMAPGAAGIHAKLALGAEVYVEFVAGDRSDPLITAFAGRGVSGFVPQGITIGSPNDSAPLVARQGDGCEMIMPPMVFTGTFLMNGVVPTPFTAVGQPTTGKLEGVITGGSTHNVKVG